MNEMPDAGKFIKSKIDAEINVEKKEFNPLSCVELLRDFKEKAVLAKGEKLQFSGVGQNDVYNISKPFSIGGETVLAGRVEAREAWADSHVQFFKNETGILVPADGAPTLQLEDGFATHIGDETIIGGVDVYPNPTPTDPKRIDYRTAFYRGHDFPSLKKFALGPENMKDVRLTSLANNKIAAFTRPQGGSNGNGKIGYIELDSLDDINAKNLLNAKIIENQFAPEEWGGANELHLLPDGQIGVLGHVAYRDEQNIRHYYAISFVYNPKNHQASPLKIIATRENFPAGPAKTAELVDVIFPGGLVRHDDGTATLYAGLSDTEAGSIKISDPFIF